MHTHIRQPRKHTYTKNLYAHLFVQTHVHTHMRTQTHAHVNTYIRTITNAHIRISTHRHTHTHTHTHMHLDTDTHLMRPIVICGRHCNIARIHLTARTARAQPPHYSPHSIHYSPPCNEQEGPHFSLDYFNLTMFKKLVIKRNCILITSKSK